MTVAREKISEKKRLVKRSERLHGTDHTPTLTNCKNVTPKKVDSAVDTKSKEVRKQKEHVAFVQVAYKN